MDLDELRTVRRTERQKDSLQHLRDSFYADAAEYISELKRERDRAAEAADNPFSSPEVGRLTDEIESAEEVVEAIYERRVGKVVKQASFAAADMPTDEDGLTREEHRLFSDLVARIRTNRDTVLDLLAGEGTPGAAEQGTATGAEPTGEPAGTTEPGPGERDGTPDGTSPERGDGTPDSVPPDTSPSADRRAPPPDDVLSEAMGGSGGDSPRADPEPTASSAAEPTSVPQESSEDGPASPDRSTDGGTTHEAAGSAGDPADRDGDRVTIRVTRDVGRILGVDDREYDLAREDVIELPATNAGPLIDRDAAERLD